MIHISQADGVQTWKLSFEPVNAIDPGLLDAMEAALRDAIGDPGVAVVVITSGLRIFSAGADAAWMGRIVREKGSDALLAAFNQTMDRFRDICLRMRRSDLLFLAAINGHALAGGLELAAACDLRWVADNERLQLGAPEMKLFGVLPSGGGGSQFLARLLGPARALQFLLEAESVGPAAALRLGLVERVCPPGEIVQQAQAFGAKIAAKAGRVGVNAAKRSVLDASTLPVYEGLEVDRLVHWDSMRRGGFLPGVEAFVAEFGGRG
jgi:enoyl-CoA hydratase